MTRSPIVVALLALLVTVTAHAVPPAAPAAPRVLSTIPADLTGPALRAHLSGVVPVRVHVTTDGIVDSARAIGGDARLRTDAEAAARWAVYEAPAKAAWTTLPVRLEPGEDAPQTIDFRRSALDAERAGDLTNALLYWSGAVAHVGTHASLRNVWALRERSAHVAQRMNPRPPVASETIKGGMAIAAELERTVARADHLARIEALQPILREAPWWDDPYRCLAASSAAISAASALTGPAPSITAATASVTMSVTNWLAEVKK